MAHVGFKGFALDTKWAEQWHHSMIIWSDMGIKENTLNTHGDMWADTMQSLCGNICHKQ